MKKNWTMRVGALMLALTLITSCFVGGTFAKYVTAGNGKDSARVAKFGVVVEGEDSMFKTKYETDDESYNGEYSVESSTDEKVVAPGTEGALVAFTITGTPEVAVRVAFEATNFDLGDNWVVKNADGEDTFYCPIIFDVNGTKIDGKTFSNVEDLEAAVKAEIANQTQDFAPNTILENEINNLSVSWAWDFDLADDYGSYIGGAFDKLDTALGNQAAANTDDAGTITLDVTATVTQID